MGPMRILIILCALSFTATAQIARGGGMFYHLGVGRVTLPDGEARGAGAGLGGRIAFGLTPSFRVGGMGFSTGFDYRSRVGLPQSLFSLRCGGLTAEYGIVLSALRFSAGVLVGGGSTRNLHIHEQRADTLTVTYRRDATMILMPLALAEYRVRTAMSLAVMVDWILGTAIGLGRSYGPRVNIGVLFER